MNWKEISKQPGLTEDFIREQKENLIWSSISAHQNLSEEFILEMSDLVNWYEISECQHLSLSFIINNITTLHLVSLHLNSHLSFTKDEWNQIETCFFSQDTYSTKHKKVGFRLKNNLKKILKHALPKERNHFSHSKKEKSFFFKLFN